MEQGCIHLYTGDGKGKTTAAAGLALRALGAGMKVIWLSLMKDGSSGEVRMLRTLSGVTVLSANCTGFWTSLSPRQREELRQSQTTLLCEAVSLAQGEQRCLLVADEAASAWNLDALDRTLLEEVVANKPPQVELVLTGRGLPPFFWERADYISDIQAAKHPYTTRALAARPGIEY